MKRSLLAACAVALTAVAGCGTDTGSGTDTGAPAGSAAPSTSAAPATSPPAEAAPTSDGVPPLAGGDPADLSAPVQAGPGTGEPQPDLVTEDVVAGTGPAATPADTVDVRYTGTLYADGTLFDSSWARGEAPTTFPLSGVVPGFSQGIEGMQVGGRRVIVIPPELGYGDTPPTPSIPAGATLVFVVDLAGIG